MKKLTLLLFAIIIMSCSSDDDNTNENNSDTANFKIEYTSQLSDADLNLDVTFTWNDENGQLQSETTNIVDPQAYSELADEKTTKITNTIGVIFKIKSGSNFLSDTYVKVTNTNNNTTYDVTNSKSIGSTGGAIDNNTLTVIFDRETSTFESEYSTTN
ncbi:hypothetical protein Q4Q34_19295 [Flavivirga abyssicola]|uniref:hypothetical protein n=1 Tax=Flavivirga abyssicola TaxID=3063533 RepID=UPI0026DF8DF0|nr:hypothetical protein [Flavivirga sp. MEBiC07777]WVK13362.1 hypothetical protein Q4Q34_19295 [Flavivirga sp. MEBiC07777]